MFELGAVIIFAALLGIVMRLLKQPIILAYLAAGLLIGGFKLLPLGGHAEFSLFSDLGVMFLLFLVGLEINYSSIKLVGKTAILIGLAQVIATFLIGFLIGLAFHFSTVSAAYIAIALSFSSTIIVVKLLSEKKDLNSLYGKLSVGFLLVQDFVAMMLLVVLSGLQAGDTISFVPVLAMCIKGIALFVAMLWMGRKLIPYVFDRVGRSQELLFIVSLAWVFVVAAIVSKLGFSIEIAGFLAGLALANSYENFQIASHFRPLRDFFIVIFFVMLGSSVAVLHVGGLGWPILVFSLFVLIGNPLITLALLGLMGYRRRTSFLAGMTMAQISEFSLILTALGLKLGHIQQPVVGLITAVGIISIVVSTYLIMHAEAVVRKLWDTLAVFERLHPKNEDELFDDMFRKPVILIGAQRIGHIIASHVPKKDILIIDFDPSVIARFRRHGYTCLLGDISDRNIFETAHFEEAQLVISTSPDFHDNMTLLSELKKLSQPVGGARRVILRADNDVESGVLYRKGADYVIRPHLTSGHFIGDMISKDITGSMLWHAREKDYKFMEKIVHL